MTSRVQWAAFRLRAQTSATMSVVLRLHYANGLSSWRTRCNNNSSANSQARHTSPQASHSRQGHKEHRKRRHQTSPTLVSLCSLLRAAAPRLTSQRAQMQPPHLELALDSSVPTGTSGVDPR